MTNDKKLKRRGGEVANTAVCLAKRDPAPQESRIKTIGIMFYVYILKSTNNGDLYVGYCTDLKVRFKQHNDGRVRSTKTNRPWQLVYYEAYRDKKDATRREKQLKNHRAKLDLKAQLQYSLEQA